MEFSDLVTLLLFFIFFILPTIFKQVKTKVQKDTAPVKKKATSLIGRIGDQIRQHLEELEKRAGSRQEQSTEKEDFWQSMAENESMPDEKAAVASEDTEVPPLPRDDDIPVSTAAYRDAPPVPPVDSGRRKRPAIEVDTLDAGWGTSPPVSMNFRQNPLQNAIVLSEVFSRPLALRSPGQDSF